MRISDWSSDVCSSDLLRRLGTPRTGPSSGNGAVHDTALAACRPAHSRSCGLSDKPMDKVFIRGLQIDTIIGVHGWERQLPRPLLLTLDMGVDKRDAAASDPNGREQSRESVCQYV